MESITTSVPHARANASVDAGIAVTTHSTYSDSSSFALIPKTGIVQSFFENEEQNRNPDRVCFVDALKAHKLTFSKLKDMVYRFGAGLQDVCNFQAGDVLVMYAPNMVDYAVPVFGTLIAGGIVSPSNPSYTVDELIYQLQETGAKILIAHGSNLAKALLAAQSAGLRKSDIYIFGNEAVDGIQPFSKVLIGERIIKPIGFKSAKEVQDSVAFLCFSSGTTGKSKGVMTTHGNIMSNIYQYSAVESDYYKKPASRVLSALPFFHIYGLTICFLAPLYMKTPIYVLQRFNNLHFCEAVQNYRITFTYMVPPILLSLARDPIVDRYDLSSLEAVLTGAAPAGPDLIQQFQERFNKVVVKQAYGLTEGSGIICVQKAMDLVQGSVGVLVPGIHAKVVDENGNDVGFDARGELLVKGPNIMKGYLNRPEVTAKCIDSSGYYHTGDEAIISKSGHVSIVGRIKELIKYKGFQVAPAELEDLLLKHPDVVDSAVIGVYCPSQATEIPCAYVVLKPGINWSEETATGLKRFVADKVATYKHIHTVVFSNQIPKNASGKILRDVLRENIAAVSAQQS